MRLADSLSYENRGRNLTVIGAGFLRHQRQRSWRPGRGGLCQSSAALSAVCFGGILQHACCAALLLRPSAATTWRARATALCGTLLPPSLPQQAQVHPLTRHRRCKPGRTSTKAQALQRPLTCHQLKPLAVCTMHPRRLSSCGTTWHLRRLLPQPVRSTRSRLRRNAPPWLLCPGRAAQAHPRMQSQASRLPGAWRLQLRL